MTSARESAGHSVVARSGLKPKSEGPYGIRFPGPFTHLPLSQPDIPQPSSPPLNPKPEGP